MEGGDQLIKQKIINAVDRICLFVASKILPKRLIYWVLISAWAVVTSGKYSNKSVNDFDVNELLRRYAEINKL